MPKISVIVPVYNAEKWLGRCVDSILSQTFADFELLLIDDGSIDASGTICDRYAETDSRIRVFHKSNGGVSSARNSGIYNSDGCYLAFVDSDDWVEPEYLECLYANIADADLSICGFEVKDDCEIWSENIDTGYIEANNIASFLTATFPNCHLTAPWIKLYKKSIIDNHKIRFNENLDTCEDVIFVLEYLLRVDNISCSSKRLYNYYRGEVGLSRNYDTQYCQMPQISACVYHNLCKLAQVRQIDISVLYGKILGARFTDWVFPREYSLKKLYNHFRNLSDLPEIQVVEHCKNELLGRKYIQILNLIAHGHIAVAVVCFKMMMKFHLI